jgi:hypothetical protein
LSKQEKNKYYNNKYNNKLIAKSKKIPKQIDTDAYLNNMLKQLKLKLYNKNKREKLLAERKITKIESNIIKIKEKSK